MIHTSNHNSKPSKTFVVSVGNMPAKRKKWWQFWRKEGDSAEELLKSYMSKYNITRGLRSQKITELWSIFRPKIESDYWFPNK